MEVPDNLKKRRVTDEELARQLVGAPQPVAPSAAQLASSNPLAFLEELESADPSTFTLPTEEEVFALSSLPHPGGLADVAGKGEPVPPIAPELLAQEQAALGLLQERYVIVGKHVAEIGQIQREMGLPPSAEAAAMLQHLHTTARQIIAQTALDSYTLGSATILSPATESLLANLVHELYIQAKQLDLYDAELRLACEGRSMLLAALVVTKQPFPQTVMKQRHIPDAVHLKLLHGTQVAVRVLSKIRAHLVMEEYVPLADRPTNNNRPTKSANKSAIVIDSDTADLSNDGAASFSSIKFSEGSEQKRLRLAFEVTLSGVSENTTLRSDLTEPLIVLTHQTQWELSEGVLFRHEAFRAADGSSVIEITWPRMANCLQRHFLRVTQGARPLSRDDLWFLHARLRTLPGFSRRFRCVPSQPTFCLVSCVIFPPMIPMKHLTTSLENSPRITMQQCDQFWRWFGKVLYKIRHLKFLPFWVKGVIYGFINKNQANALLEQQPSGTFLIRFSEGNAGQFAIAYRKDGQIHHYLMTDEDQKKAFPDFLAERNSFDVLLRVTTDMSTGISSVAHCAKCVIVEEFQPVKGRKEVIKVTAGYDEFVK